MEELVNNNKDEVAKLIKENSNLQGITLEDNYLVYNGSKVNLNKLNLLYLINSKPYSKLAIDIKNNKIDAQTFFEVAEINSFSIEKNLSISEMALNNLSNEKTADIISVNHFKMLLTAADNLSEKERMEMIIFEKYMEILMLLDDELAEENYLTPEQNYTCKAYKKNMDELITLNIKNVYVDNYLKMLTKVKNEKQMRNKLSLKKQTQAGFVNALFVIITMLVTGILIGTCAYFFL